MNKIFKFYEFLNENSIIDKVWYHGSNKPIKKFLYDMVGKNTKHISDNHGHGIYFISDEKRAKTYGDIITKVTIDKNANILHGKITKEQCQLIYAELLKEHININSYVKEALNNPKYDKYSVFNDTSEFYYWLLDISPKHFKNKKDVSDFLLNAGIDGMYVINDVNDEILVIFNENVIKIMK
jgi:hypothetical protein